MFTLYVPSKKMILFGIIALLLGFASQMLPKTPTSTNLESLRVEKSDMYVQSANENTADLGAVGEVVKGIVTNTPTPTQGTRALIPASTSTPTPTSSNRPTNTVSTPTPTRSVPVQTATFILRVQLPNGQPANPSSVKIITPEKSVHTYSPDANGSLTLHNLTAGNYTVYVYFGNKTYDTFMTLLEGQTRTIIVTVDAPLTPTITPTPTPTPDTQAPTLSGVSGPYDWGSQGWCVVVYRNQIIDNNTSNDFFLSYALDGVWGEWGLMQATKCFTDASAGTHTISAKVKDPAGNQSNVISVSFTK